MNEVGSPLAKLAQSPTPGYIGPLGTVPCCCHEEGAVARN